MQKFYDIHKNQMQMVYKLTATYNYAFCVYKLPVICDYSFDMDSI